MGAMQGAQGALGGAAAGSALGPWGAAAGGLIGGIAGLFGGGGDDAEQQAQQQAAWLKPYWQQILDQPTPTAASTKFDPTDPLQQKQMDTINQLDALSKTGESAQDRAAYITAATNASNEAKGRQGAIQSQAAAQGGGVATGGQKAVLQAQAAQDAANRVGTADANEAGAAADRRGQYLMGENSAVGSARTQNLANANAINQFNLGSNAQRISAVEGAGGQAQMGINAAENKDYMDAQNWQNTMNTAGMFANAGAKYFGNGSSPTGSTPQPSTSYGTPAQRGYGPNAYNGDV